MEDFCPIACQAEQRRVEQIPFIPRTLSRTQTTNELYSGCVNRFTKMSTTSLARAARCTGASTSYSVSRKAAAVPQLLKQLARFNPNQLSSYAGVKLLLPVQGMCPRISLLYAYAQLPGDLADALDCGHANTGRRTMLPQGSAAARKVRCCRAR